MCSCDVHVCVFVCVVSVFTYVRMCVVWDVANTLYVNIFRCLHIDAVLNFHMILSTYIHTVHIAPKHMFTVSYLRSRQMRIYL